jgi:hypothetical protein
MKIALCVPAHDMVHLGFAKSLANLTAHLASQGIEHVPCYGQGTVIPNVRLDIAKYALNSDAEYLMWLDSDMHFPRTTVNRLLEHNKEIVAATYSTRLKPQRSVAFTDRSDYDKRLTAKTGVHRVFAVGMGCMLVHRDVFKTLPQPWFQHIWNEDTLDFSGEDIYFCKLAGDYGYTVNIDVDLSNEVAHYGTKAFLLKETNESN